MSMTTEQALAYCTQSEDKVADSNTPSVEESKSEDINVDTPNEVATPAEKEVPPATNDGEHPAEEVKGSDEPKAEAPGVEDKTNKEESHPDHKAQRDYAFIKQKKKLKDLQERYDRDTSEKDKRIKELEEELNKRKLLTSENFTKADGSKDIDAFVNWKAQEQNLKQEADRLKSELTNDQRAYQLEMDRINTERCFQGKELEDYNNLIIRNGAGFADAIHEKDRTNVVFKYLDTVQDYPIVLRELMTNHNKWLPMIFRSTDPESLRRNTAKVTDLILDEYYDSLKKPVQNEVNTQPAAVTQPPKAAPAIPVIGKQISNAGATTSNEGSLLSSINSINAYLKKNKRH